MSTMHAFITAFAKSVSGVSFEQAALGAFYSRRVVSAAVFPDIARFTKPVRPSGFQFTATGTDDFFRFVRLLVSFFIAVVTKPFCIMRLDFFAFSTLDGDFARIFPRIHISFLIFYQNKFISSRVSVNFFQGACHEN